MKGFQIILQQVQIDMDYEQQSTIEIKIIDVKNITHSLQISNQTTGYQLKQQVYKQFCKQLLPKLMKLTEAGRPIENSIKLSDFNVNGSKNITFVQEKIDLIFVSAIKTQSKEDPIYSEIYTYEWPCGHLIGKNGMVDHIRAAIKNGENKVKCPYQKQNGDICGSQWDFKLCRKIGIFTKEETEEFEKGLNSNWLRQNTKNCPKCNQTIYKVLKQNRVKCPNKSCTYDDFCYLCLNPWVSKIGSFCGNVDCQFIHQFLMKAEWDRKFILKDPKNNNGKIQVITPRYRACPNCRMPINNFTACKHTECTICKKKFCFVCLSVFDKNWKCGSYDNYCGKVAQTQKFDLDQMK